MDIIYDIIEKDKQLFLFLNSKHTPWLDPLMLGLSSYTGWVIVCLLMAIILYLNGGNRKKEVVAFFLMTVGFTALVTKIVKEIVARPRPIHNEAWESAIYAIEKYETSYSFFSSHASTAFAMAVFFYLYFKNKRIYGIIALVWAAIVAYSRLYLAKHFPIDIFCGMVCGIFCGILGYRLFRYYTRGDRV